MFFLTVVCEKITPCRFCLYVFTTQGGKAGIRFVASCFLVLELPVWVSWRGAYGCGPLSSAMAGWVSDGRGHSTVLGSGRLASGTFPLPVQPAQAFVVKQGVHVSGASPESISSLLSEVAECGTHYARLSHFSLQPVLDPSCGKGLVFQVLPSALWLALALLRTACVLGAGVAPGLP